jgi:hypothetical protein
MVGQFPVGAFPEGNELEDLLGFLAFAQVGVGVTEDVTAGILSQKHQDPGLAAAAGREVMPLDNGVFSVIRHGMKIQVERLSGQELHAVDLLVRSSKKAVSTRFMCPPAKLGRKSS